MHSYAVDSGERTFIILLLVAISVFLAWAVNFVLESLKLGIPWLVGSPSGLAFFGLLYKGFDLHMWRWSFWRSIKAVKTPDLSGTWKGCVVSSYDDHSKELKATIDITQTWTQISIRLEAGKSGSSSLAACISVANEAAAVLTYQYKNDPHPSAIKTMEIHYGTAALTLRARNAELDGYYYTGRGRQTYGSLNFIRE